MDITNVVEAVFALLAIVVTTIVVPYIKSKTSAAQQKEICGWVAVAVSAAEQLYKGSGRGAEKKAFVLDWLEKHGITVDASKIDAMIESAVYVLQHGGLFTDMVSGGAQK